LKEIWLTISALIVTAGCEDFVGSTPKTRTASGTVSGSVGIRVSA
jgi:hypothetical protein